MYARSGLREKNIREITINHKVTEDGQGWRRLTRITNEELERFRLKIFKIHKLSSVKWFFKTHSDFPSDISRVVLLFTTEICICICHMHFKSYQSKSSSSFILPYQKVIANCFQWNLPEKERKNIIKVNKLRPPAAFFPPCGVPVAVLVLAA